MAISNGSDPRASVATTLDSRRDFRQRYLAIRCATETLCEPLAVEDYVAQSMPDASPVKWHLAHTTWFFETFVLQAAEDSYQPFDPRYRYLFNSYYNAVGEQYPRPRRGVLSRPTVDEIYQYRRHVDRHMADRLDSPLTDETAAVVETGLHHEQQHQELILTDLKHLFGCNPTRPAYRAGPEAGAASAPVPGPPDEPLRWETFDGGIRTIGHEGSGFCYDNECPQHDVIVRPFQLADRPVTNAEYVTFLDDGGYSRPEFWLSEGWDAARSHRWQAPLYWERRGDEWWCLTLSGMRPIDPADPVCHLSYFEADAYARWARARLPTEAEWETVARMQPVAGRFFEDGWYHPRPAADSTGGRRVRQMFGDVWEWTSSAYAPYPGYRPPSGPLGEYNGKFMCSQIVLRGGSCATPRSHIRRSYRNFFKPAARWQFSGIRLARDWA